MNGVNGHTTQPATGGKRLRQLLSDPSKTVIAPGVYDGITARLAISSGAECLYMVTCPPPQTTQYSMLIQPPCRLAQAQACPASAWPTWA